MNDNWLSALAVAGLIAGAVFVVGLFGILYADRMGWMSPPTETVVQLGPPHAPTPARN
jgi:hypothetical protein